jgi:hypothetical protein
MVGNDESIVEKRAAISQAMSDKTSMEGEE